MHRTYKWIFIALLTLAYWCSRPVHIASDLPKWKTFYYSQVDELFYTIGAFNMVHPVADEYKAIAQKDFLPVNLFEDAVTAGSLAVFGNNHLGLRFPSMLMGYFVLLLLFLLVEKRFGNKAAFIASIILLLDIGFLLSNRVAEPTIFRLFGVLLVIYFLQSILSKNIKPSHFFFAGFIGCFGFLFFYPTNFFVAAATFLFLLLLFITQRQQAGLTYRHWVFYIISSSLCAILFLGISAQVMGDLARFSNMGDFSSRVAVAGEKTIFTKLKTFASNIKALKNASFFYFNPYMLVLSIVAVGYFLLDVLNAFRKQRKVNMDVLITCFLLVFLLQCVFINDYPRKKLLILLPFVIYAFVYCVELLQEKFAHIKAIKFAYGLMLPVVAWSAYFQYKFVFSNPTYYYRNAMMHMRKYNGKLVVGNLSYAFRLYNTYTPLLNYYAYKYHDYNKHQQLLKQLSADNKFAGSIFFSGDKYGPFIKEIGFWPADTILSVNPNIPNSPIFLNKPISTAQAVPMVSTHEVVQ